jgi:2-(3-amino-3-carboxypropyl)histidine synthase
MTIYLKQPINSTTVTYPDSIPGLPENYNFEIQKTLNTINKIQAKKIALQFPDGLLCYAPILIDTIQLYFKNIDYIILDDVVYGACCIDDEAFSVNSNSPVSKNSDNMVESLHGDIKNSECSTVKYHENLENDSRYKSDSKTKKAREPIDLLIHYGHSCLIPISEMQTRVLYIFVDIKINIDHLYKMIIDNFKGRVAVIGTIQFNSTIRRLKSYISKSNILINATIVTNNSKSCCKKNEKSDLQKNSKDCCKKNNDNTISCCKSSNTDDISKVDNDVDIMIPQIKPLSPGIVLGCTSPKILGVENVIYIGDGRFHLESAMINFYKYCPFTRKLSREYYDYDKMLKYRKNEINRALYSDNTINDHVSKDISNDCNNKNDNNTIKMKNIGVILGSLGRQGNKQIFDKVIEKLESLKRFKIYKIILNEINQELLDGFDFIDSFVQVSCPRLSIDWGICYKKPLLTPFEVFFTDLNSKIDCKNEDVHTNISKGTVEYEMDYYSREEKKPWNNYF